MSDPVTRLNAALEGRYAIESELGEGGMATVYLAEDIKHNRNVALKVLKPELAAVVGAERFLAEIQVTANLQHPHILPLFDSGEADSFLFYVMPYVEGETLRDRIKREKQLPVEEAVGIATAVANALDYAHRHKVIHRDIKPANILIQDGEPVVSDFGIALALGAGGGDRLTETGLSLGTPYYMSPEQATGDQPVGSSTDTYALGSVLYEMLVGEPPYPGTTTQAVLGKIIAGKPVSAREHRSQVSANVDSAIRCAIEKLPADRFGSVEEFAKALADPGFRHGEVAVAEVAAAVGPWKRIAVGFAVLAGLFGLGFGWSLLRPEPPQAVARIELTPPSQFDVQTFHRGFAVSPDGRTVVFADRDGLLYHQDVRQLDPEPIQGTSDAWYPFFSPDGEWVGYFDQRDATLKKARLDRQEVQTLAPVPPGVRSAGWGPDGTIVFHTTALDGLWRVPDTGGEIEQIPNTGGPLIAWMDMLPNGRAMVGHVVATGERQVVAVPLETGERRTLLPGRSVQYVSTGHLIFSREDVLWAVRFDPERLAVVGAPAPIVQGMAVNPANSHAHFAVGGDLLLYEEAGTSGGPVPVWVGRDGSQESLDAALTGNIAATAISPDGRMVAFEYLDGAGDPEAIWVYSLDQETFSRLTFGGSRNIMPFWSPDGSEVGFSSDRDGLMALYSRPADLSSDTRLLFADPEDGLYEASWTPDGSKLVFRRGSSLTTGTQDIGYAAPHPDSAVVLVVNTPAREQNPSLSPDGRWLAYWSNESGESQVYVRPFPGPGGRSQVSTDGGFNPVWAHNGRELFYFNTSDGFFTVAEVHSEPAFGVDSREPLFAGDAYFFGGQDLHWDVSPDDQRLLMIGAFARPDRSSRYVGIQNLSTLLREVLPD